MEFYNAQCMHVRVGYCTCTFVVCTYVYTNLVVTVQYQCLEAVSGLIPDLFTYMYMYVFKCTVKCVVKKTTHLVVTSFKTTRNMLSKQYFYIVECYITYKSLVT